MKAKRILALFLFLILYTVSLFAQPAWFGGTPTVTPNPFSIEFNYGITTAGKVYVILINFNYTTPVPTSLDVKNAAIAGPTGGRISTWVIDVPDANKNNIFTINARNQIGGNIDLIPNHDYTFYFVAADPAGVPLQAIPVRILTKTLPCPKIDILTGFSQPLVCLDDLPTATFQVVLSDPPTSGILKGTQWTIDWGDGNDTTYLSAADYDIPSIDLRRHVYSSTTSCNYVFSSSVRNPCGETRSVQYVAVVHGKDDQGDGILQIVNNATGSSVVEVCEGVSTNITLQDNSTWNCQSPVLPGGLVPVPNNDSRNIEWLYGQDPSGGGASTIAGVLVGGVAAPVSSGRIAVPTSSSLSEVITIPATATSGQYFRVYLKNWNKCNWENPDYINTYVDILVVPAPPAPTAPSKIYCVNDTKTLYVTSAPAGTITWYSNPGLTVVEGTGITFTPVIATPGTYTYYVTDKQSSGLLCQSAATTVTLTVNPKPATPTLSGVKKNDICFGVTPPESYVITATATATPLRTGFAWFLNGVLLPGRTSDTLIVRKVEESGLFRAASVGVGPTFCLSDLSDTLRVTVHTLLNVTNPLPQAICENGTAIFFATTTEDIATWHWEVSFDGGTTWSEAGEHPPYSGSFTNTLTLTMPPASYNGQYYRLEMKTPNGQGGCAFKSDKALLTVDGLPTANAGAPIIRCSATPLTPIPMTGATKGGTSSTVIWSGGEAMGTWTQNTNPALATFTPSIISGSFVATLTVTGTANCGGVVASGTRNISWSLSPAVEAGPNLSRCDGAPLATFTMTGASASGSYGTLAWSGGSGLGTWTQDANPALATFTPSVTSGSFTATLTITGIGTCAGTNPSDTKTISWAQAPVAVPGPDINRCNLTPTAPIVMTGALSSGTFVNQTWSGGAGLGNWTQNANPALAVFTPTTNSGSFTATLSLTGSGACTGTNVSVTKIVAWSYAATVNAGPDQSICATASVTLAGTRGGAATSASWSGGTGIFVPNNTTLNAVYTPSAAEQAAHTVTLILTTNDPSGICPAVTDDITISIGTLPTSAVLASPNDACFGDGPSYMNLVITGGAPPYTISYKLDGVVKPNITNYYSSTNALLGTLAVGTHTLEITNIKDGCNNNMPLAGLPGLRTFIIYQKPVSNPGSDKGVCNTLDAGLSATPSTGTGTWSVVSSPAGGSINFLPGINSPNVTARANDYGSFVVRWTEVNGVCSSFRDIIVAYEKQAAAGAAQNLCGTLSVTLAGNISSAGIGTWTKVSGPVGSTVSFSPNANAPDAVATVSEFGTYIFRWTLTNPVLPNCSTSSDVTITLEKAANAGVEQRLCGTFAATLAGNIPAVGTGTWSLVGGPGGVTFTPDVNTPAATATVTTYGTYVFRWIVSNGVFCSTNDDVTVIYNPAGQVNPVAGQVLCNGNSTTDVIFSTVNAGGTTTYAWTNSAPGIGLPGAGSGDILSFPVVNTGTAPVIATLEVIPTYSDGVVFCPGPKETFTITVNPPAQVNKPADRVFCNGFITPVINFTTVNTIGTTTYSWSNSDPSIGLAAGGTDFIPTFTAVNTGFSPVTATITVVPVFTYAGRGCPGASETFTITINPSGQVIQPLNLVICHNNPGGVTFATNNLIGTTSYHWTNDNTATGLPASGDGQISFSGTNAGTEPITGNISVTPTFTFAGISCPGSPKTFTITVNPAGQVDQPADLPVCNGETGSVTFTTVNTVGTTTYSWTNSNTDIGLGLNGTGPISFIATNPNTFPISALIEVTPTFNFNGTDCPGTPKTFTITINPTPKLISSLTPADVCSNSLFSYTPLSSTAFTAFDWSRAMVAGITPAGPTSGADNPNETLRNLTNIPIGVTYQYILTANGCANTQNVIVNIKPEPVIEPDQTANICSGITTNHFIRLVNFTNPGDNVTFTWPAPVLSPADPRFTGGAERSTASSVNIADVFVNTMGVNGTATYTITPFKNGCAGTPETIIMTVRSQPVLDTSLGGIVCSNSPISLVLQVAAGSVPATFFNISGVTLDAGLSADAGNATISNTTAPAGYLSNDKYLNITGVNKNVTYRVQPVYAPDCFGDAVDVVVTIRPQPYIVPAQTKTVCSGIAIGKEILLSPVNTPAGSLFNWGIPAMSDGSVQGTAGGNVPADPAGTFHINDIIDNAKGIVITATYSITAVSPEGCTSGAPVTVVIYVNPEPLVKVISGDDKICINEKNLVYSVASEPTSTFHWAVPPAIGTKTFDYNTSSIILDAAAVAGSGNITVYETNSYGCDGDMSSYTVNVYTQAVPEAVTGPNDVCAYSTATYSVTSRAGSVYSWSIPGGAAIIGDPSAASVQVAFGNVGGNISVRETNIAGCLTNHTPLTVSVKARPTAIISGGGTICEGGTIALSVDLNGTAPFVFRYAVNGGAPVTVTTSADPYALDATLAGTYTIVDVTDATGCMNNGLGSAFVGYYPKPVGVLSGGATLCGGAGTTLTITITGGTQPFAFAYTDGTTTYSIPEWWGVVYTSTVSPAATVTYTLVSLSDGHSCNGAISGSALVTVNTPPALTLNPTNLTCYNDNTGAVDLTVAGSAPFGIVWTGPLGFTANTEDITLLRAGTYNVTVTDTKGCISTGSVTLTEPGSVNANVTSTDIICFGAANGSITISSASGGSGVYEYTIDGGLSWVGTGNFTGLVPGNYDVRIRDIAAPVCNKILNPALAITSPAILNATVVHSDILCYGANNGSITISNPSGGFGTFGYSVDGGSNWQGSGNFNDLVPGTYHVWIRDAAHPLCIIVLESPLDITAPPLLTATVNSTNISCFGSTDGTISITAPSGGHGTFEYSINGGGSWQPSGLYTGLAPGTYNIQIRDKDYPTCYKVIDGMLSITQPAVLKATVSSSMATCNSKNDGTISITGPSGGSGNYQYTISGGLSWEISGLYSNLIPGSYDVRIRDAASTSCEIILNNGLLITQPPALSATVIKTNITCNGEDDGTIIITNSSGGYGTFDYSIDGGLGWQPSNSFINLGSGTHSVWIRDRVQTTCSLLLDPAVVIFEPAPLVASLDSTNVTCFNANNGTITISAAGGGSGAYQYSINGGGTWFGSGNFINLGPGSYNVIMRDAVNTGCFITLDPALVLSEPSALSASPASTNVTCFGLSDGTITISNPLGGAGSYEYTINGGSTWQLSGSYTGLISGNYNVQIRDVLHPTCVTVLNNSLSISQPGILYSTVTPTMISCNGANDGIINLTGPSGGYGTYEYSINGGTDWQSSGMFSSLIPGFYNVRIRDGSYNTCVITLNGSLEITQPGVVGASLAYSNITCNGNNDGAITISSPTGGYGTFDYTINGWSTWQGSGSFTNLAPGLYNVQIRDRAHTSCVTTLNGNLSLSQPDALTGTVTGTNITCNGANNGKITISGGSGGYGTFEYSIDGGVTWQSPNVFNGLLPGSYGAMIRDAAHISCSASLGSISISQPGPLSGSAAGTNITCAGADDGIITISSVSGGYGLYEYTIDGGGTWQSSVNFTALAPGFYNVQMRDANNTGCTKTINSSLRITEPATLNANYNKSDITCNGLTDGRITITLPAGGSGFYEFTISGGAPWQASGTFTGLSDGTYNVQMRDATHTGCITILNPALQITEPAILNASVTSSDLTCNGISDGTINISGATGGYGTYQYSINGGTAWFSSGSFSSLAAGVYDVWMLDASNPACRIQIDPVILIAEPDQLSATLVKTNVTCFGSGDGTITISAPLGGYGNYEYTINGGGSWQSSGNFTGLGPGNYNVLMRDADHNACIKMLSSSYNITQPAQLNGVITRTMVTCNGADDGIINITSPSGGYGLYEYSINGGTDWFGSGLFTSLAPDIYDVKIRDASNISCIITLNSALAINEPTVLGANVTSSDITCNGADDGTINISFATGGYGTYEYRISGSLWQGTGYFSGLAPDTYVVEIRDKAHPSCVIVLNPGLVLTEPPVLSASVSFTAVSCFGANNGTITITDPIGGYGTYAYSVNGGSAWQSSGIFTNLAPGNYDVRIRDASSPACVITLDPAVSITEPSVLSASVASANVTCYNASDGAITVSSPSGGYGTWEFSVNGGTTWQVSGNFTGLAPGFYNVKIRDAAHIDCSVVLNGSLRITEPGILAAIVTKTNVTCFGSNNGTIAVTGASGGYGSYEYSIDGGGAWQSSGSFANLIPGNYDVRIRDGLYNGCVMTLNPAVSITEPALLDATVTATMVTCSGANDGIITVSSPSGGSGSYLYSVNGGTSWQGYGTFNNIAPGNYDVMIKDAANPLCIILLEPALPVTQPGELSATISRTNVSCFGGADGSITISSPAGGYGSYEFSINGGGTWQSSGLFTDLMMGSYNILIRDATHINCMKVLNSSYLITQPGFLTATVSKTDITCNGSNNGIITISSPSGGYGTYEYSVNGGMSWQVSGNYTGLIPGIYSVRMRDAAHTICWMNLNSTLVISEPLVLSMTSTGNIVLNCNGDNNGAGSFFAAGGTMPYTFTITSNTTGATIPAQGFNSQSFTGAGAGTITVQITDSHGCTSQATIAVSQPAILTPGSIATNQVLCSGQNPAQLTEATPATGGPAAYNYQWQYGVNIAGPFINIAGGTTYQYTPPANTTTTLYYRRMVTSGSCAQVYSNIVEVKVNPVPFAVLSGGETICPGQSSILIVNISSGVGPFEVVIENQGTVSGYNSGGNISVSPASTTTYKLLRVRDSNGCEVTSPTTNLSGFATVVVRSLPVITTSPSSVITCELNMASFTVAATGSDLTYQWYVDEGSGFNPVTDGGIYYGANYNTLSIFGTTRLMNNNRYHVLVTGCGITQTSADAVLSVNTVPEITDQPSDTTICMNGGASFTVSATGTAQTYRWQVNTGSGFGDISDNINYNGTNSSNLVLSAIPGTFNNYTFRVKITGTCGVPIYSNFVVLRVLTPPSVTLNPGPKSVCNGGGPVVFSATGTGLIDSIRWQVYSGGTWSDIHDNSVYSGTSSQQLTLNSVPLAYNGNQYRLALKGRCITISSAAATLTVNPNPVVDFSAVSPLNACGGVPLVINGNPTGGSGSYIQHTWTGDAGPLNNYFVQSPSFNTIIPGTYNLNYKVKDSNGCFADDDMTVLVDKPDAAFSQDAAFGCTPVMTTFSKDMTGIDKFWWNFDDGSPADSVNTSPSHLFTNTNPSSIEYYNVTLKVQSSGGCTDSFTSIITVYPEIDATFSTNRNIVCSGESVTFTASTPGASRYFWKYGDGISQTTSSEFTSHIYTNFTTAPVVDTVQLVTTSFYNCTDTSRITVTVMPVPMPQFSAAPALQVFNPAGNPVVFTDMTNAGTWNYSWRFGDGASSASQNPSHTYTSVGDFNVVLSVSNSNCSDSIKHTVHVTPIPPIADFDQVPSACAPLAVRFNNTSLNTEAPGTTYRWDFGDGNYSSVKNPSYTYYTSGIYRIELTVTGPGGTSVKSQIVEAYESPEANFKVSPSLVFVNDESVRCFNLSQNGDSYIWEFGDGDTSKLKEPFHKYMEEGIYDITLWAYSDNGCSDVFILTPAVTVEPAGELRFSTVFTPNKDGPIERTDLPTGGTEIDQFFFPPVREKVINYKLQIFNRWGVLIFESRNINIPWNGYYKGKLCPQGVYVWYVEGKYANGRPFRKAGDVTLLH